MKNAKKTMALSAALLLALTACGDETTEVTRVEETHEARVVGSLLEVSCNGTTGEIVLNNADRQIYVCAGGEWITMKGADGHDGRDGSDGRDGQNASSAAYVSSGSGSGVGNCTTRHISRVGVDGVVIDCGGALDTLWSTNVQFCGDSVYDASKRFCDHRDNRIYRWAKIGSQTWMAENLKFCGKFVSSSYNQGNASSYSDTIECYRYDASYYNNYGALYQWHTAMRFPQSYDGTTVVSASQIQKPHRGICPEGWHVPDSTEWYALYDYVSGGLWNSIYQKPAQKLKRSAANWWTGRAGVGTDNYGFDAVPAGQRTTTGSITGYGIGTGKYTYWWSTNMDGNTAAWAAGLESDTTSLKFYYGSDRQSGFSVRCLKD